MTEDIKQKLLKLRICVAYLGEKEQGNWWTSSFLSRSGEAFLTPVFPKTTTLARVNGASGAARVVHDEYIGTGDVYHLFRLPENIEQDFAQILVKDNDFLELITSEDVAGDYLATLASEETNEGVGPLLIEETAINDKLVCCIASAYKNGFNSDERVYPYYLSNT